jgi:hypothetical protein
MSLSGPGPLPGSLSKSTVTSITTLLLGAVRRLWSYFAPLRGRVEPIQVVADLCLRSRRALFVENVTLRRQVSVLRRTNGRRRLGLTDRLLLLIDAALLPAWRKAIVVVQPETILRWHRTGFRLFWRRRSKPRNDSGLAPEEIGLIRKMPKRNRFWGAERIRGELLKLDLQVSNRTIQKYMKGVRSRSGGQSGATFLANHADATWACDFIQAYDILFRQVYAFFVVHIGSRNVVYAAARRNPTREWTTQQLRNATMDGQAPKILLRDRDDRFGASLDRVPEVRAPDDRLHEAHHRQTLSWGALHLLVDDLGSQYSLQNARRLVRQLCGTNTYHHHVVPADSFQCCRVTATKSQHRTWRVCPCEWLYFPTRRLYSASVDRNEIQNRPTI